MLRVRHSPSLIRIPQSATGLLLVLLLFAGSAAAQARQRAYVGAAVTGDWTRLSHTESVTTDPGASTNALGVLVRAGAPFGRRWGVEAEFVRDRETSKAVQFPPIGIGVPAALAADIAALGLQAIPFRYSEALRQRESTFTASAWYRRRLGWRAGLVISAGLAVARVTRITAFSPRPLMGLGMGVGMPAIGQRVLPIIVPPETRVVSIGVGPTVAADLRVRMVRHLEITGGGRLLGIDVQGARGVLFRASAGANWRF